MAKCLPWEAGKGAGGNNELVQAPCACSGEASGMPIETESGDVDAAAFLACVV